MSNNAISLLLFNIKSNLSDCIFVSNEKEYYDYFLQKTGINIEYYKPKDFEEIVTIVKSCKNAYLGFSSIAVIAHALHKEHVLIGSNGIDFIFNNLKNISSSILDIFI